MATFEAGVCAVHSDPFQCRMWRGPTAVQAWADAHDTPLISPSSPLGASVFHSLPFHSSTSGYSLLPLYWKMPTAMQKLVEVQDTSFSSDNLLSVRGGSIVVHDLPFHSVAYPMYFDFFQ